jgi:hypothetical protein
MYQLHLCRHTSAETIAIIVKHVLGQVRSIVAKETSQYTRKLDLVRGSGLENREYGRRDLSH